MLADATHAACTAQKGAHKYMIGEFAFSSPQQITPLQILFAAQHAVTKTARNASNKSINKHCGCPNATQNRVIDIRKNLRREHILHVRSWWLSDADRIHFSKQTPDKQKIILNFIVYSIFNSAGLRWLVRNVNTLFSQMGNVQLEKI